LPMPSEPSPSGTVFSRLRAPRIRPALRQQGIQATEAVGRSLNCGRKGCVAKQRTQKNFLFPYHSRKQELCKALQLIRAEPSKSWRKMANLESSHTSSLPCLTRRAILLHWK
jgi:hypothetical protein